MSTRTTVRTSRAKALLRDNRGASMVEYALMLALVLVLGYVGYKNLGSQIRMAGDKSTMAFY